MFRIIFYGGTHDKKPFYIINTIVKLPNAAYLSVDYKVVINSG